MKQADYSQAGEQDILLRIISDLGPDYYGVAVDLGARDGSQFSNIKYISELYKWTKVQFDIAPLHRTVVQADIRPDTVNELLDEYVPGEGIDLMSLDIDGNDYWVWGAIRWMPSVIVLEYNQSLAPDSMLVMPYNSLHSHDLTDYYGASFGAVVYLSEMKGYTLTAVTRVNAIFVRNDLAVNREWEFNKQPLHQRVWPKDPQNREWVKVC
jgi:hypothetical protein